MLNYKNVYLLLIFTIVPNEVLAESDFYWGLSFQNGDFREDDIPRLSPKSAGITIGSRKNENFSLESRLMLGAESDETDLFIGDIELDIKYIFSGFLKFNSTPDSNMAFYGLVGFSKADFEADLGYGIKESESDTGLSYGVGVEFGSPSSTKFTVEYVRYLNESSYTYNGVNIGFNF